MSHYTEPQLYQVEQLIFQGKLKEAQLKLQQFERKDALSNIERLQSRLLKSSIQTNLGEYESSLQIAEQAFKESQELNNSYLMIDSIISMVEALKGIGGYDKGLNLITQGLNIIENLFSADPIQDPPKEIVLRKTLWKISLPSGHNRCPVIAGCYSAGNGCNVSVEISNFYDRQDTNETNSE